MLHQRKRIPTRKRGNNEAQIKRGYGAATVFHDFQDAARIFVSQRGEALNFSAVPANQRLRRNLLLRKYKMYPHAANYQH
jgi:hypothetical protein